MTPFSSVIGKKIRYVNGLYGGNLTIPTFGRNVKVTVRLRNTNQGSSVPYSIGVVNLYDYQLDSEPSETLLKSGSVNMIPITEIIQCSTYDNLYITGGNSAGGLTAIFEYV